jgi:hypothetical protein
MMWRLVIFRAAIVVSTDHYRTLRALDIPVSLVWQRWMYWVFQTVAQVINRQPDYRFLRTVNLDFT